MTTDVSAELEREPAVHAARIGVVVKDSVVTLAGQVNSCAETWNAEHLAQRVSGGRAMATGLTVRSTSLSQHTDADIAGAVDTPAGVVRVAAGRRLQGDGRRRLGHAVG